MTSSTTIYKLDWRRRSSSWRLLFSKRPINSLSGSTNCNNTPTSILMCSRMESKTIKNSLLKIWGHQPNIRTMTKRSNSWDLSYLKWKKSQRKSSPIIQSPIANWTRKSTLCKRKLNKLLLSLRTVWITK